MLRDPLLHNLHEELTELLDKIPPTQRENGYIQKLLTACLTLTRSLDALNDRENQNTQDLHTITAHLSEDLSRLEARQKS